MTKYRFLCSNHRRWLQDNPGAATGIWQKAYGTSLALSDEARYTEAANQAGAAFEAAEIDLGHQSPASPLAIHRYADTAVLLTQLLYRLGESKIAGAMLATAIGQLEQLLMSGVERKAVLAGCQRLLRAGDELSPAGGFADLPRYPKATVSTQIH